MNDNRIGVRTAYPRRENNIEAKRTVSPVKPAESLVGKVPPDKIQQMGARQGGNPMPYRLSRMGWRSGGGSIWNNFNILHRLRIDVNFAIWLAQKTLNLLYDAAFRAVTAIQERGNNRYAQFKPAQILRRPRRQPGSQMFFAQDPGDDRECLKESTSRRS